MQLPAGAKFCFECAHPVGSASPAPRFAKPESYTPRHLAEKILTSKAVLEGERKQVTVLFADLKGSMELLADRDPEEARKILDPVLELMMEAVHRYEGTVNQVMGDGIMALFGAPIAHEDHAVRACYAAMRMQRRVSIYADEIQQQGGTPVQIRVGVNSGEVVVRAIGRDLHMDYTAVGQTTHLAARMEQMAKPGSVLLTGDTLKLAEGFVEVRSLGAVPVKGLGAPTQVYELAAVASARSRLQASVARGLSRFVGRDLEVEQLAQALDRAAAGHGQAVAVVGEAGVGKSRLAWEFTRSHRTHGWLVLESGSVSYGKGTPYLPVIELLKTYCRIQQRDEPREIRERVAGKLLTLDRALDPLLTPLLALLDVPVDDAAWTALDPPQRRQRTLDAIKRLLLRESQVQPLLLLFEDLHWMDTETQALLDGLVESLPTARLLLLVNYRPEYQHAWGSKTYYRQLRIDPLPSESANELLDSLLGPDKALDPLKQLLIERTEANPLFLEESVRTLVETGALAGQRGTYQLRRPVESLNMPATVQTIIAARIDRLEPSAKQLIQSAAVIGKDVPMSLLLAIADAPEHQVRDELARLQAAEFLYETKLFPDLEYTFKHALTHEVTYGSLLLERRRVLHAHIVETLERIAGDRVVEKVDRLAHHAVRGEVWDKALVYCRQAGEKVMARSAYREAVRYFEDALRALQHLPASQDTSAQAIDLRFNLRQALFPLGEFGRILDDLRHAASLAESLGDPRRLGRVYSYLTNHYRILGEYDHAVASGRRALAIATDLDDVALQVTIHEHLGLLYFALGHYTESMGFLKHNVAILTGTLVHERFGLAGLPSVVSRSYLTRCLAEMGAFGEGIIIGHEAVQIAEVAAHPYDRIAAYSGVGMLALSQGDLPRALSLLEQSLDLCQIANIPIWFPVVAAGLGSAYALAGRSGEGLRLLEQAFEKHGSTRAHPLWMTSLSEAYLLAEQLDDAYAVAGQALVTHRKNQGRGNEAHTLRLLGDIASVRDPRDLATAEDHYRQALVLANGLGMRPLVAHCHLGLGKLYRRTSRREQAQEHLTTATAMYDDMGMTYWLEKAEAETRELG
jgi:class 3 adenylate cyclase/tetratricopeptide (TPR) repeat protein